MTKVSGDRDATFGFTGPYFHPESGLLLTAHRAYDAQTGRWFSEDPIGLAGGFNLYSYVNNQPNQLVDPLGLGPKGAAIGGTIGGVFGAAIGLLGFAGGPLGVLTLPQAVATGIAFGTAIGHGVEETLPLLPKLMPRNSEKERPMPVPVPVPYCPPGGADKWTCLASGHVTPYADKNAQGYVQEAYGFGPTEAAARAAALKNLQGISPPGTYMRHPKIKWCKRGFRP